MRSFAIAVLPAILVSLSVAAQSPPIETAPKAPEKQSLEEATKALELILTESGIDVPKPVIDPRTVDIEIEFKTKKPIVAPPTPPPTPAPQPVPIGPGPFMPSPPELENYRQGLERLRKNAEKKLDAQALTIGKYDEVLDEYHRRIDLYRKATAAATAKEAQ